MHDAHVKYEDLFIIYADVITYWISYEAETSPVETCCKTIKDSTGATNRSGQAAKPVQEEKVEEDGAMAALMRLQQLAISIGWGPGSIDTPWNLPRNLKKMWPEDYFFTLNMAFGSV